MVENAREIKVIEVQSAEKAERNHGKTGYTEKLVQRFFTLDGHYIGKIDPEYTPER